MRLLPFYVLFCLVFPVVSQAEESVVTTDVASGEAEVETNESQDPKLIEARDSEKPFDGLAECAAILEVASSRSTNLIERRNMQNAAFAWLTASDNAAAVAGIALSDDVWNEKVSEWSAKIRSVSALSENAEWLNYCKEMGVQHGLGTEPFDAYAS